MSQGPGRLVLLGRPVGHSLSPRMHNAALRAAGIPLTYEALDVPASRLEETILALRRQRGAGNVTIPYKEAVAPLCDRLSDSARATGAVNTFWTSVDGALVGDNTDVDGFAAAARTLLGSNLRGHTLALLGAGGGAAAVLHAMKRWEPRSVRVYARDMTRAQALLDRMGVQGKVVSSAVQALSGATFLVNATPVGLNGEDSPLPPGSLPPGCAVLDLVYRPGETALVREARQAGNPASDGMVMLVEQGALAFERWFGVAPDREAMWSAMPSRR